MTLEERKAREAEQLHAFAREVAEAEKRVSLASALKQVVSASASGKKDSDEKGPDQACARSSPAGVSTAGLVLDDGDRAETRIRSPGGGAHPPRRSRHGL